MIIVRAPMRVSFGGGGTDIATYYQRFGGFVVSSAVARYAIGDGAPAGGQGNPDYVGRLRAERGVAGGRGPNGCGAAGAAEGGDRAVRAAGKGRRGIDLLLASEAQPGTGLGSSSAMAVALVLALGAHSGLALTPEEVADLACCLEIDYLGMPIGKQDQLRCRVDRGGARLAAVDRNRMGLLGCAAIEPSNDDDRDEYASRRSPESRRLVQVRRSSGSGMDPGVALRTASGPVGGAGSSTVTREQGIGRG